MKYCQHCGKELMDAAVVCMNCGCPANSTATAAPFVPVTVTQMPQPPKTEDVLNVERLRRGEAWFKHKRTLGLVLSIVGGLLLPSVVQLQVFFSYRVLEFWYYTAWAFYWLVMLGGIAIAVFGSLVTVRRWSPSIKEVQACARAHVMGAVDKARLQEIFDKIDAAQQAPAGFKGWYIRNKKAVKGVLVTLIAFAVAIAAEVIIVNLVAKPYEELLDGRSFISRELSSYSNEVTVVYTVSFSDKTYTTTETRYDVPTGDVDQTYTHTGDYRVRFELFSGKPVLLGPYVGMDLVLSEDDQLVGLKDYPREYVDETQRVSADPATLTEQDLKSVLMDRLTQYGQVNNITAHGDAVLKDGALTQGYTFMGTNVTCYIGTQNGKVVRVVATTSADNYGKFNLIGAMMPASVCYGGDPIELHRTILANGTDLSEPGVTGFEMVDGAWSYTYLQSSDTLYVVVEAR